MLLLYHIMLFFTSTELVQRKCISLRIPWEDPFNPGIYNYGSVLIIQQKIPPEATKAFHSCLFMSFNTENGQDPL